MNKKRNFLVLSYVELLNQIEKHTLDNPELYHNDYYYIFFDRVAIYGDRIELITHGENGDKDEVRIVDLDVFLDESKIPEKLSRIAVEEKRNKDKKIKQAINMLQQNGYELVKKDEVR